MYLTKIIITSWITSAVPVLGAVALRFQKSSIVTVSHESSQLTVLGYKWILKCFKSINAYQLGYLFTVSDYESPVLMFVVLKDRLCKSAESILDQETQQVSNKLSLKLLSCYRKSAKRNNSINKHQQVVTKYPESARHFQNCFSLYPQLSTLP